MCYNYGVIHQTDTSMTLTVDDLDNLLSLIDFHEPEDYDTIKETWGFDVEVLRDKICDMLTLANQG